MSGLPPSRAEPRFGGVKASGAEGSRHSGRDRRDGTCSCRYDDDCCNGFKATGVVWHGMLLILWPRTSYAAWWGQEHGGSIPLADTAGRFMSYSALIGDHSRHQFFANAAIRGLPRRLVAVRRSDSLSSAQVREGLTDRRFGRFEAAPPPNPPPCACTSAARVRAARHKVNLSRSHLRRWRSVALGGPLQRACRFCFAAHDGQARTSQIAEWCRPEIVCAGGKPTAVQIAKHARALRSIGAKRVRREGRQWVWRLGDSSTG
jgi:hypothetical protein